MECTLVFFCSYKSYHPSYSEQIISVCFYCFNISMRYLIFFSNLYSFPLISPCDIVSINKLTLMLKIIDQCDINDKINNGWSRCDTSDDVRLDLQNFHYPIANKVAKGYSNATVWPSFRNILVNTLESTSFNGFLPNLVHT